MLKNALKGLKETIRAVSGLVVVGMSLKTGSMLAEDIRNGTNYILNKILTNKKEEA